MSSGCSSWPRRLRAWPGRSPTRRCSGRFTSGASARARRAARTYQRKFFYLFTCEYCFSHYVAAGAVLLTGYRLLLPDWRGALLAWFTLVWVANIYMSLFGRLRLDIKRERVEIKAEELKWNAKRKALPLRVECARAATSRRSSAASTSGAQGLKKNAATPSASRALLHAFGRARRQHHDRNVFRPLIGRQPLHEIPAIAIGHREIGHDHVGLLLACAARTPLRRRRRPWR